MMNRRVYLDNNSTAPLNNQSRAAMIEVMDLIGNPSSVHLEGRQTKNIVEKSREKIANICNAKPDNLIFTSGATEGAALLLKDKNVSCAKIEHSCVLAWCDASLKVTNRGTIILRDKMKNALQMANSETGILQSLPKGLYMSDIVQAFGKIKFSFQNSGLKSTIISAHKIGGPKGVGAIIADSSIEIQRHFLGGGQENGYRSGTENVIGIAGFAAAAEVAQQHLDNGDWEEVEALRNYFEEELLNVNEDIEIIGKNEERLPNTSYFCAPGWAGENQVIQMDLAGFAVSAGSACSSGKVGKNTVLRELGYSSDHINNAIRVSLSVSNTKRQLQSFIRKWSDLYKNKILRVV